MGIHTHDYIHGWIFDDVLFMCATSSIDNLAVSNV